MHVTDLTGMYDYHYWATHSLLDALRQLRPDQFVVRVAGSYGSIRNTLVHTLSAEWGWLDRCGGPPRGERLQPEQYPTLDSLRRTWDRVEGGMRALLSSLSDPDLSRRIAFTIGTGPVRELSMGDLLQHAAVHAIHHRGQVAVLMRELGHAPGDFDWFVHAGAGWRR